ncbi:MAG: 3'-5' exonuclease [Thermodesulfovibrionales bacterium]|jgi:hypothetical protein
MMELSATKIAPGCIVAAEPKVAPDRFLYVDTETTDKVPGQIAQLAVIAADAEGKVESARNFFFSVGSMSPGAEAIHHLSPAVLQGLSQGRAFGDCLYDLAMLFFAGHTFTAHNAAFDLRFVRAEFARHQVDYTPKTLCTMKAMTPICRLPGLYKGTYKWPRVEEALRWLKIAPETVLERARCLFHVDPVLAGAGCSFGFHDARFDVTAVMLIHQWLRENRKC